MSERNDQNDRNDTYRSLRSLCRGIFTDVTDAQVQTLLMKLRIGVVKGIRVVHYAS